MTNRRRHLGSIYTTYPAKRVNDWLGYKFFKVIAAIFFVFVWSLAYYVIVGVVNFCKNNFTAGATETTTWELYRSETSLWVLGATSVLVAIGVFRSKIADKKNPRQGR